MNMSVSLFLGNIGPYLAQILSRRPHPLSFFLLISHKIGDSININNLCCNPVVLKKIGKTSKNSYFGAYVALRRGQHGPHPK